MTAVTPIRRPDELLDRCHAAAGHESFPGRATEPGECEGPIGPARWFPRNPIETSIVYRRGQ
jgi:hypothetical protein